MTLEIQNPLIDTTESFFSTNEGKPKHGREVETLLIILKRSYKVIVLWKWNDEFCNQNLLFYLNSTVFF